MKSFYFLSVFFFVFISSFCNAQISNISVLNNIGSIPSTPMEPILLFFEYDEAGNQIYRGPCITCKTNISSVSQTLADQVANKIQAAPVPVITDLTVIWDLSIKDYITKIDLLPYNAFQVTESVSIKSLSTNSYIFRMSNLPYGV